MGNSSTSNKLQENLTLPIKEQKITEIHSFTLQISIIVQTQESMITLNLEIHDKNLTCSQLISLVFLYSTKFRLIKNCQI